MCPILSIIKASAARFHGDGTRLGVMAERPKDNKTLDADADAVKRLEDPVVITS